VGDQIIYLIDTDVLVAIRAKKDSQRIYSRLIKMATDGDLKTVRQVFDELETFGEGYKFLFGHKSKFLIPVEEQYCVAVQEKFEVLKKKADYLYEQTGSKNAADPWLVAVASTYKYVLVTNERRESPRRIPAACQIPETTCRCISGAHFLYEVGLVEQINPAHISTSAFFADP
jgi:putative component of toxin-antitoxin plasmid stabilization module